MRRAESDAVAIDRAVLRRFPLRSIDADVDKDGRGSVLVIGGTRQTPGGVLLAGSAALRAGAGRICLATVQSMSAALAVALPEARVVPLVETEDGSIDPSAADSLGELVHAYDAVLLGSGTVDADTITHLVDVVLGNASAEKKVVLDAAALAVVAANPRAVRATAAEVVLIPNPKEMAALLRRPEPTVSDAPQTSLVDAVHGFGAPAALRGAETWITAPGELMYVEREGTPALATAGSGDVLAGALTGLLARNTPTLNSLLWTVHAHAKAGTGLAEKFGTGFLASELLDALPVILTSLEAGVARRGAS